MESHQEVYQNGYCAAEFTPENAKNADHFIIEDLLDLPNDESMAAADGGFETVMTDSSTVTVVDTSCNSSFSPGSLADPHFQPADFGGPGVSAAGGNFSGELCVPYDDMAELEWLSNFVEESFSSEDLQKLQLIQGVNTRPDEPSETHRYQFQPEIIRPGAVLRPEMSIPAKARSKRSRAAPGNWTSRLLVVSPTPPATVPSVSSSPESDISASGKKSPKPAVHKKKEGSDNSSGGDGRKCLHCATDKTPQWRTGPMGPKTLCNACGVRYKSGRLVPEYRPAASPTFVLTKHSNSHRKVLELRRQKELQRAQHQQQEQEQEQQLFLHHHYHHHHQNMMFDVTNGDDYLIHQHIGPDFRQMI